MPPSASRAMVEPTTLQMASVGMAPTLRLAEGAEGVGRLARLAQDEDERAVVERGVAVAELAGVLDFDGQVRQPLDQVFADQGRVPARTARGQDDAADAAQGAGREVQAAELGRPFVAAESAAAGVADGVGLLADLLEHVVGVLAQFVAVGPPVDPVDPRRDRPALAVDDLEVIGCQADDLAVLQERDPRRVRRDGRRVAGEQMFAVAEADDQRTAQPRADDFPGPARADDGQSVGPLEPRQDLLDGREQVAAGSANSLAIRWATTSVSVWLRNATPWPSSDRRSAAWFSITPL